MFTGSINFDELIRAVWKCKYDTHHCASNVIHIHTHAHTYIYNVHTVAAGCRCLCVSVCLCADFVFTLNGKNFCQVATFVIIFNMIYYKHEHERRQPWQWRRIWVLRALSIHKGQGMWYDIGINLCDKIKWKIHRHLPSSFHCTLCKLHFTISIFVQLEIIFMIDGAWPNDEYE